MRKSLAALTLLGLLLLPAAALAAKEAEVVVKSFSPLRMAHFKVATNKGAYSVWLEFEDGEERFQQLVDANKGKPVRIVFSAPVVPGTVGHISEIRAGQTSLKTDELSNASLGR